MKRIMVLMTVLVFAAGIIVIGCAKKKDIPLEPSVITEPTAGGTATSTNTPMPTATVTETLDVVVISPTFTPTTPDYTPTATATQTEVVLSGLLDNCDDGDNANAWGGYWYVFDDLTSGSDDTADGAAGCTAETGVTGVSYVYPNSDDWAAAHADADVMEFVMSNTAEWGSAAATGYGDTGHAARITGYAVGTNYGECLCNDGTDPYGFRYGFVGYGTNLADPIGPVDVTAFTGLRFWHKGDGKSYRVKLGCTDTNVFPLGENDNMYGYVFATSASWQQFKQDFSTFTQESGWGNTPAGGVTDVLEVLESLQWQTTGRACKPPESAALYEIDLLVDEIEFY